MDVKIHRPTCRCAATGRPISAGETFYSALVRDGAGVGRIDVAGDAWTGPPADTIAWWRSIMPTADEKGPTLASPDVLLDVLERLEGSADEAALRYLLALFLVRRRILRIAERQPSCDEGRPPLRLACPRRATEYLVEQGGPPRRADGEPHEQHERRGNDAEIQRRLEELLWSGEAA